MTIFDEWPRCACGCGRSLIGRRDDCVFYERKCARRARHAGTNRHSVAVRRQWPPSAPTQSPQSSAMTPHPSTGTSCLIGRLSMRRRAGSNWRARARSEMVSHRPRRQSPKLTEVLEGRSLRSLTRAQKERIVSLLEVDGYDVDDPEFRAEVRRVIIHPVRTRHAGAHSWRTCSTRPNRLRSNQKDQSMGMRLRWRVNPRRRIAMSKKSTIRGHAGEALVAMNAASRLSADDPRGDALMTHALVRLAEAAGVPNASRRVTEAAAPTTPGAGDLLARMGLDETDRACCAKLGELPVRRRQWPTAARTGARRRRRVTCRCRARWTSCGA